jgi:hypothetical protein
VPLARPRCPTDRFLFVNTHTFGRHHNQMQEMMNVVLWARTLNRTAVLGAFRHNHKWMDPSELYDFSRVMERYCLVDLATFKAQWAASVAAGRKAAVCIGQSVHGTILKKVVRNCRLRADVPAHYDSRKGFQTTKQFLVHLAQDAHAANFVCISGELGFFLRAGLRENAAVFALLEPSAAIGREVAAFHARAAAKQPGGGGGGGANPFGFAVHLRQREKECMKEVNNSFEDGRAALAALTAANRAAIAKQCTLTTAAVDAVIANAAAAVAGGGGGGGGGGGAAAGPNPGAIFMASDHQNKALEAALQKRGAAMYEGGKFHTNEFGGMQGLAVDFFTMCGATAFTGNQLSSITQNCCYRRLGRGLACHGFVVGFTLYHAQCLVADDAGKFVTNAK